MTVSMVLWDLDGTLVDSRVDIAVAGNVARHAIGLEALDEAAVAAMVGDGMGMLLERLLPAVSAEAFAQAKAAFIAHYASHCADRTTPYAGVDQVLAVIAQAGIPQAVVTNKPLAFTTTILEATDLARWFGAVQGGDEVRKPDPDGLYAVATVLGGDIADGWMVGDHHTDLAAGRAAGCRRAFCTWGLGHIGDEQPDAELQQVTDLLPLLGLDPGSGPVTGSATA